LRARKKQGGDVALRRLLNVGKVASNTVEAKA